MYGPWRVSVAARGAARRGGDLARRAGRRSRCDGRQTLPAPMAWTRASDERRRRQVSWLAGHRAFASPPSRFPSGADPRFAGRMWTRALAAHSCGHSRGFGDLRPRAAFPLGLPAKGGPPERCIGQPRLSRKAPQRVSRQPAGDPVVFGRGAQGVVEDDGRCVPIQHRPFHPSKALVQAAAGQGGQQGLAGPRTAVGGANMEVFHIEAVTPSKVETL